MVWKGFVMIGMQGPSDINADDMQFMAANPRCDRIHVGVDEAARLIGMVPMQEDLVDSHRPSLAESRRRSTKHAACRGTGKLICVAATRVDVAPLGSAEAWT